MARDTSNGSPPRRPRASLSDFRRSVGVSQKAAAAELGLKRPIVSFVETGSVDVSTAFRRQYREACLRLAAAGQTTPRLLPHAWRLTFPARNHDTNSTISKEE